MGINGITKLKPKSTAEKLNAYMVPKKAPPIYESLAENNFKPTLMPICPITGLPTPTIKKETQMKKSELKSLIRECVRDDSRYGTNYTSHDKHTNDTAARLRAQLAGEDKYKQMMTEDYAFTSSMTEDEIVNENLNYALYGEDSKFGKHLAMLQHELDDLDRQGLQKLKYYPIVKRRVSKFKQKLDAMEAAL